jgi:hypothetical protein
MSNSCKTLVGELEVQNHVGDLTACGRRIIKLIIKKQCFKVSDRSQVGRHRIQQGELVKTIMNFRLPLKAENSLPN